MPTAARRTWPQDQAAGGKCPSVLKPPSFHAVPDPSKALVALGVPRVSLVGDEFPSVDALLDGQEPSQPFLAVARG